MRLQSAPHAYSVQDQRELRRTLELSDNGNHKRNQDVEIGVGRLILTAPNGARWSVTVSNTGTLSAVAL